MLNTKIISPPGFCWGEKFLRCENSEFCSPKTKPGCCHLDHFHGFSQQEQELVRRFAYTKGHSFGGIELDIALLNQADEDVTSYDQRKKGSWQKILAAYNEPVKPLLFAPKTIKPEGFMIRSSEFGSKCPIARLISKFDKEYFERQENDYAVAGTAHHRLRLTQPVDDFFHNNVLEEIGIEKIARSGYCEQEAWGVFNGIFVLGHLDARLYLGNALAIFDYKSARRGSYESIGMRKQLLSYALCTDQMAGNIFSEYFLITAKPLWNAKPGAATFPAFTITKVPKNDVAIERLLEEMQETVEAQRRYLDGGKAFLERKAFSEKKKLCINPDNPEEARVCFVKDICDKIAGEKDLRRYLMQGCVL